MEGIKRVVVEIPASLKNELNKRIKNLKKLRLIQTQKQYIEILIKDDLENKTIFNKK